MLGLAYIALIVYFYATGRTMLGTAALFGAAFGILIERGQICFTSAFRDLWISGRATMTKAIAVGMAVSSVATLIVILVYGLDPITKLPPRAPLSADCSSGWVLSWPAVAKPA